MYLLNFQHWKGKSICSLDANLSNYLQLLSQVQFVVRLFGSDLTTVNNSTTGAFCQFNMTLNKFFSKQSNQKSLIIIILIRKTNVHKLLESIMFHQTEPLRCGWWILSWPVFFVSIGPVSMLGSPTDYGTRKRFVATFKCYPLLWMLHSVGKPRLSVCCRWLIRSWKVRGQLFCHKHQTNKLGPLWVTHNLWGTWQGWEGGCLCDVFGNCFSVTFHLHEAAADGYEDGAAIGCRSSLSPWYTTAIPAPQPAG